MNLKGRSRFSHAHYHYRAVVIFAEKLRKIEDRNDAVTIDLIAEHQAYAAGSVMSAASFLEAAINEFWMDPRWFWAGASVERISAIAAIERMWPWVERMPILAKYDIALALVGGPKLNKAIKVGAQAALLIEFRNALAHYKAEWDDMNGDHKILSKKLDRNHLECNRITNPIGASLFPTRYLSHATAKWALESSKAFYDAFEKGMRASSGGITES